MAVDQRADEPLRLGDLVVRRRRIGDRHLQQLAGGVDDRQLAAGAVRRIDAEHDMAAHRRLQQQAAQIGGEDADRVLLRPLRQLRAHLALDRRRDEPLVRVLDDGGQHVPNRRRDALAERMAEDMVMDARCRNVQPDAQHLLALAAVDRERAVRRQLAQRLLIVVVHLVHRFRSRLPDLGADDALLRGELARPGADAGVVGDALGDDVHRALERFLRRLRAGLARDVLARLGERLALARLREQPVGQRLQPPLPRDGSARLALLPVRPVQILDLLQLGRGGDRLRQLRRQLALLADQPQHLALAVLQIAPVGQLLLDAAQLVLVELAGHFLAVARDERNRIALVQQRHRRLDLAERQAQLLGDAAHDPPCSSAACAAVRSPSASFTPACCSAMPIPPVQK